MQNKIALEEHFATEETVMDSAGFMPKSYWPELKARILDIHDIRLKQMDQNGIEMMLLSLNAPAVQAINDRQNAVEVAQRANDFLAEQIVKRSDRFRGFAALAMQDPDAATRELERCKKELGFVGALVNGFSNSGDDNKPLYYDMPEYLPFWEMSSKLDMPFYLHPRNPLGAHAKIYEGHEWLLGPTWAFAHETATHALRLMGSGLFDKYSNLNIILGHMGEGLPFNMWRIDYRNAWVEVPHSHKSKNKIAHYFQNNFHITTSGNFRTQSLIDSMLEIGSDRIMFSADWPFENVDHAANWFDAATISELDREKIGRTNAVKLFNLE